MDNKKGFNNFKTIVLHAITCSLFVLLLIQLYCSAPSIRKTTDQIIDIIPVPRHKVYNRAPPIILYWNEIFTQELTYFLPTNATVKCPYKCIHKTNREKYGHLADVRVIHQRFFNSEHLPPNNPNALNVKFNIMPPYLSYSNFNDELAPLNYFNATISYRSNSEVYFPYDAFVKRDGSEAPDQIWTEEQIQEKLDDKQRGALVAISTCETHSQRSNYVDKLSEIFEVTRVGQCNGTIECEKDSNEKIDSDCMRNLIDSHHFYLAFENSVCPEYTTENFWRLKQLIVPIVLSREAMNPYIPNDSYIAASDFESPQALAYYLQFLMKNQTEYRKYFSWTKNYRKTYITDQEINAPCQLCKLAYQNEKLQIEDYKKHWSNRECAQDYAFKLLTNKKKDLNNVKYLEKELKEIIERTNKRRVIGRIL